MSTSKLEFSLRLRHETDGLSVVSAQFGLVAHVGWDKGEPNRTLQGVPRSGIRKSSYRSFPLKFAESVDLEVGLSESLKKLSSFASVLHAFSMSGGIASLAVAWYCDGPVGGDRIPANIIAEMARLSLTLDLYLYLTPAPPPDGEQLGAKAQELKG